MASLILDELPEVVKIDGSSYSIDTDFKTSMLFELTMLDNSIDNKEKVINALELYFGDDIPTNVDEAIKAIMWFYSRGKEARELKHNGSGVKISNIYNFEYDADYIYSAFMHDYNIDLQDVQNLHWWKFKAMFDSLNKDNKFCKIMEYRSMDLKSIKDKEQRQHYKEMQELYKIPTKKNKDEEEKLKLINEALMQGKDVSNLL